MFDVQTGIEERPAFRAATIGFLVKDLTILLNDFRSHLRDAVRPRGRHRGLDRPGLLLTKDDHERDLAVRQDSFIGNVASLRNGKLALDLDFGKGAQFRISEKIAAIGGFLSEHSIEGVGDHEADLNLRQGVDD